MKNNSTLTIIRALAIFIVLMVVLGLNIDGHIEDTVLEYTVSAVVAVLAILLVLKLIDLLFSTKKR